VIRARTPGLAEGGVDRRGGLLAEPRYDRTGLIYPEHAAAGLWCTATDLLHLAQAIQAALAGEPGAVLPQELAEQMTTRQLDNSGLGLGVQGDGGRRVFGHNGGNYGYQCVMVGAVESGNAAAVMISSDQGFSVVNALAVAIMTSTSWQIT
jgi:Beta-lactamase